jgi:DNA-binding ferritin-like protein
MKCFHWNVEGDELYKKFKSFFSTRSTFIDWVAERIRVLGQKTDGHLFSYLKNTEIIKSEIKSNAKQVVSSTLIDSEIICDNFKKCIEASAAMNDLASTIKLASILEASQIHFWQLSVWNIKK